MLPENLSALRRKSGLSQEQLAEKIGVSRQAISKWETGLSTPDLEKLVSLGECFGVTVDELIGTKRAAGPAEDLAKNLAAGSADNPAKGADSTGNALQAGGPPQKTKLQPDDESLPARGRQRSPEPQREGSFQPAQQGRPGVFLCGAGAVCLLLFGLLSLVRPAFAEQMSESSVITLNGTGILMALFLLLMGLGIVLILKKK